MSDGCTMIPDTWFGVYLKPCCDGHDIHYKFHILTRKQADILLRIDILNEFVIYEKPYLGVICSSIIYYGVRLFGWLRW